MANLSIRKLESGTITLSGQKYCIMASKVTAKSGSNVGQPLITLKINHLLNYDQTTKEFKYENLTTYFLTPTEFQNWLTLLYSMTEGKPYEKKQTTETKKA